MTSGTDLQAMQAATLAQQNDPEHLRTPLCKITSTGEIEQRFRLN